VHGALLCQVAVSTIFLKTGTLKPNVLMLSAIWRICRGLWSRGLPGLRGQFCDRPDGNLLSALSAARYCWNTFWMPPSGIDFERQLARALRANYARRVRRSARRWYNKIPMRDKPAITRFRAANFCVEQRCAPCFPTAFCRSTRSINEPGSVPNHQAATSGGADVIATPAEALETPRPCADAKSLAETSALGHIARLLPPECEVTIVDFAHLRSCATAGMSQKPHDVFGVSLCRNHHMEQSWH